MVIFVCVCVLDASERRLNALIYASPFRNREESQNQEFEIAFINIFNSFHSEKTIEIATNNLSDKQGRFNLSSLSIFCIRIAWRKLFCSYFFTKLQTQLFENSQVINREHRVVLLFLFLHPIQFIWFDLMFRVERTVSVSSTTFKNGFPSNRCLKSGALYSSHNHIFIERKHNMHFHSIRIFSSTSSSCLNFFFFLSLSLTLILSLNFYKI